MASYHFAVKAVSRAKGRSATAAAAYRSGTLIECQREGRIHDYSRRTGVEQSWIAAPNGSPWAQDRASLWNSVEAAEKRKDAKVAREYELGIPCELDRQARHELVRGFADELVARYGIAADVAIHAPSRNGDQRNWHAHVLTTTRVVEHSGMGAKTRALDVSSTASEHIEALRELWAQQCNAALERAQSAERVDHRSYDRQERDLIPQQHMGPLATAMERHAQRHGEAGPVTDIGAHNAAVVRRNAEVISLNAVRQARQAAEEQLRNTPAPVEADPVSAEPAAAVEGAPSPSAAQESPAPGEPLERDQGRQAADRPAPHVQALQVAIGAYVDQQRRFDTWVEAMQAHSSAEAEHAPLREKRGRADWNEARALSGLERVFVRAGDAWRRLVEAAKEFGRDQVIVRLRQAPGDFGELLGKMGLFGASAERRAAMDAVPEAAMAANGALIARDQAASEAPQREAAEAALEAARRRLEVLRAAGYEPTAEQHRGQDRRLEAIAKLAAGLSAGDRHQLTSEERAILQLAKARYPDAALRQPERQQERAQPAQEQRSGSHPTGDQAGPGPGQQRGQAPPGSKLYEPGREEYRRAQELARSIKIDAGMSAGQVDGLWDETIARTAAAIRTRVNELAYRLAKAGHAQKAADWAAGRQTGSRRGQTLGERLQRVHQYKSNPERVTEAADRRLRRWRPDLAKARDAVRPDIAPAPEVSARVKTIRSALAAYHKIEPSLWRLRQQAELAVVDAAKGLPRQDYDALSPAEQTTLKRLREVVKERQKERDGLGR